MKDNGRMNKEENNHERGKIPIKTDLICDLQINVLPESSVYDMIWKYLPVIV